jgi:uncharacterized protein (TIRG00374 family)
VPQVKKWAGKVFRWLVPLLISGVAIYLLLRNIDAQELSDAFRRVNFSSLILAILVGVVSLFLRVWCWHLLLKRQFPYWRVFFAMNSGYLLNNILPFRLGEFGRAILLGGRNDKAISSLEVLSSIVVERVIDVFIAFALFLGTLSLVTAEGSGKVISLVAVGILILVFIALAFFAKNKDRVFSWLELRKGRHLRSIGWLQPKIDALLKGLSVMNQPKVFWASFILLALSWGISMIQHYFILVEIVPGNPAWWVVFLVSAGALGFALPSAPAGIGVYEAAIVGAFALLGVAYSDAFAYALILHAIQFVMSNVLGFIGLVREGQSFGDLYKRIVSQKRSESQEGL